MLEDIGFVEVTVGPAADTFKGAGGEEKARKYAVYGYPFLARKPA
jgi:arsenite methyltransferase